MNERIVQARISVEPQYAGFTAEFYGDKFANANLSGEVERQIRANPRGAAVYHHKPSGQKKSAAWLFDWYLRKSKQEPKDLIPEGVFTKAFEEGSATSEHECHINFDEGTFAMETDLGMADLKRLTMRILFAVKATKH